MLLHAEDALLRLLSSQDPSLSLLGLPEVSPISRGHARMSVSTSPTQERLRLVKMHPCAGARGLAIGGRALFALAVSGLALFALRRRRSGAA